MCFCRNNNVGIFRHKNEQDSKDESANKLHSSTLTELLKDGGPSFFMRWKDRIEHYPIGR